MTLLNWQWILGGFFVLVYAVPRFNTPPTNKLSTTVPKYYLSLGLYLGALAVIYLCIGVMLAHPVLADPLQKLGVVPEGLTQFPGPLIAAMLLTTLLPNTKQLAKCDSWLRRKAWSLGNIPRAARRLSAQMQRKPFSVPGVFRSAVREKLADFDDEDICYDANDTLEHQWTKITALYVMIEDWKSQLVPKQDPNGGSEWSTRSIEHWEKYDKIVDQLGDDYRRIQANFERLKPKARTCLALSRTHKYNDAAVAECCANFREQADRLLADLTLFVARAILRRNPSLESRLHQLEQMGFVGFEIEPVRMSVDDVLTVGFGVFLVVLFVMLGIGTLSGGNEGDEAKGIGHALFVGTMVAIIYMAAVAAAIYPKTTWLIFDRRATKRRKKAGYLLSGLIAAVIAALVQIMFRYFFLGLDEQSAVNSLQWTYPWLFMSFTVAAVTAFLADDFLGTKEAEDSVPAWARWVEGGSLAGVLLIVGLGVVYPRLEELHEAALAPDWFRIPSAIELVSAAALIGFLIGFYVPHLYRERPETRDDEYAPSSQFGKLVEAGPVH